MCCNTRTADALGARTFSGRKCSPPPPRPRPQLLLDEGAWCDVAETAKGSHDGWTPLRWAAFKGQRAVADLLVDAGADCLYKAADGVTPRDIAEWRGWTLDPPAPRTPAG